MNRTIRYTIGTLLLACLLLVALFRWLSTPSEETRAKSLAIVKRCSHYALVCRGQEIYAFGHDTVYTPAVWMNRWAAFPSCRGRLLTTDVPFADTLLTTGGSGVSTWTAKHIQATRQKVQRLNTLLQQLDYYLKTHDVKDYGFHEIMSFSQRTRKELAQAKHLDSLLQKVQHEKSLKIQRSTEYQVIYRGEGGVQEIACTPEEADTATGTRQHAPDKARALYLRTQTHQMAEGACAWTMRPWRDSIPQTLLFTRYGAQAALALRHPDLSANLTFEHKVYMPMPENYTGYWMDIHADGTGYAGWWQNGKRAGEGTVYNKAKQWKGVWRADTLPYGTRIDDTGTYRGELNRQGEAEGHGILTDCSGLYYDGKWRDGKKDGFGFMADGNGVLHVGEWKADKFLGERLLYHPDRIYGIDISRFQHEIGRRVYPIRWKQLRITHLGTLSKKKVHGNVDYPVSFIYIKSTEGTTIRNKYYARDYVQARKHGIHTGSYHFFSTRTSGTAQAKHFIRHTRFAATDLPPVLDLEPTHKQIAAMGGAEKMWKQVEAWLHAVERHCGKRPILYISQNFVNRYLVNAPHIMKGYAVWIARYGAYKPHVQLTFWQLSPDGRVRGIKGPVDINVFNGYQEDFHAFCQQKQGF